MRKNYKKMGFNKQREYAYAIVRQLHQDPREHRKYVTTMNVDICEAPWKKIHGIPKSTYVVYKKNVADRHVTVVHGNT